MSFSSDARNEIAREDCAHECCARSELAAAILASGGISLIGLNKYRLAIDTSDAAIARRFYTIIRKYFGVVSDIRVKKTDKLGGRTRYIVAPPDSAAAELLSRAGLIDKSARFGVSETPDSDIFKYSCCRISFLRAAFLVCGIITNPEKAYHMEFIAPSAAFAELVMKLMCDFEIRAKNTCRNGKEVVYLKGSESVADALRLLGAHSGVMAIENTIIMKEVLNNVTRVMNCDNSNINRTIIGAQRQIDDIRLIDEMLGLTKLPKRLREIAEARLASPSATLADLGEALIPAVGKSGANSRMRKLNELAQKLRTGEEIDLTNGVDGDGQAGGDFQGRRRHNARDGGGNYPARGEV